MMRLLTVVLCCGSWVAAQDRSPILTEDGQPIKVIIGTTVVTPTNPPRLPNLPNHTESVPNTPDVLPYPRVLAVDEAAQPKRLGLLPYLLGETMAYVDERRQQVRPAAHKTVGEREPGLLSESLRETKPTPAPAQEVHVTHSAVAPETPHYTTAILQQMVAIIAAVIVLAFVLILAYFFVLRKYAPFTSLFQVQVVGGGLATGVPFVPAALAEPTTDPFADITPNVDLGLTYEEELVMKQAAGERQELAVLAHIADLNASVQSELKKQGYLSDVAPAQSALEILTNPEPAV